MKLKVNEIFDSIQGEGDWMGTMCTFIRLPGCNFKCPFCDTNFDSSTIELDTDTRTFQKHVVITGGEPTVNVRIGELCNDLMLKGYRVHVETNGTKIAAIPSGVWITCSPKRDEWNQSVLKPDWKDQIWRIAEIKLVVDDDFDPTPFVQLTPKMIWLQPCDGPNIEKSKARITNIIQDYPTVFKAGIQLHKYYEVL